MEDSNEPVESSLIEQSLAAFGVVDTPTRPERRPSMSDPSIIGERGSAFKESCLPVDEAVRK